MAGSVESSGYGDYGDYSVVTIKELDEDESTCKQCYTLRETSVHEKGASCRLITSTNSELIVDSQTDILQNRPADAGLPNADRTEATRNVEGRCAMRGVQTEHVSTLPARAQDNHVVEMNQNSTSQYVQPDVQLCIEYGCARFGAHPSQTNDVRYTYSQGRSNIIQSPHSIPSTRTQSSDIEKRKKKNSCSSRSWLNCLCHTISIMLSVSAVFAAYVIYYNVSTLFIHSSSSSSSPYFLPSFAFL